MARVGSIFPWAAHVSRAVGGYKTQTVGCAPLHPPYSVFFNSPTNDSLRSGFGRLLNSVFWLLTTPRSLPSLPPNGILGLKQPGVDDTVGYDVALEKATKDLRGINPLAVAGKSGTVYENGRIRLRFFHRVFFVHFPEIRIEEEAASGKPPPQYIQLVLLHYLVEAQGMPVADEWVPYRLLPGASIFEQRFRQMSADILLPTFGNDLAAFKRAGAAIGGTPMDRSGDAAFRFLALPRIPVACILYLGEEEIPPSINVLFDAAAPAYLPTEDLSYLGLYLALALREHK